MTDPFPGYLLESRVIIDETQVSNALSSFIDDNSRLEKKTGKRIRNALEDIVGLKQAAFQRLANTAQQDFLFEKTFGSVAGDRRANRPLRACRFRRELLAMQGHTFMMLHSEFCAVWLSLSDVTGKKNFAH